MAEKNIQDYFIHRFKIMNGNLTLCNRPYRVIGFNSKGVEDIIQIRNVPLKNDDVTCLDCKSILTK